MKYHISSHNPMEGFRYTCYILFLGVSNGPGQAGRPDQVRSAARFGPGL